MKIERQIHEFLLFVDPNHLKSLGRLPVWRLHSASISLQDALASASLQLFKLMKDTGTVWWDDGICHDLSVMFLVLTFWNVGLERTNSSMFHDFEDKSWIPVNWTFTTTVSNLTRFSLAEYSDKIIWRHFCCLIFLLQVMELLAPWLG